MFKKITLAALISATLVACTTDNSNVVSSNQMQRAQTVSYGTLVNAEDIVIRTDGSAPVGAIGGAVLGGVLGNSIGGGRGRNIGTAAGAVGGAMAGNAVQNQMNRQAGVRVEVRLDSGNTMINEQPGSASQFRAGQRVAVSTASNGITTVLPR
ncbi:glycine zipper 2TM domain-containing protein [Thorsellia kenyensis]|uniref:Glycine zipper 2TM domain-containing protein n=1 Tax=Thorsellia kenyensis TaxID=1549888 RepID=A0ABV6CD89_9GAMM